MTTILFLATLDLRFCARSFVAVSRGCPFFVVRRLLVSVVCLVAEQDLCGAQAQQLWLMHLVAPQHVESSLIRNQTGPLHWQVNS